MIAVIRLFLSLLLQTYMRLKSFWLSLIYFSLSCMVIIVILYFLLVPHYVLSDSWSSKAHKKWTVHVGCSLCKCIALVIIVANVSEAKVLPSYWTYVSQLNKLLHATYKLYDISVKQLFTLHEMIFFLKIFAKLLYIVVTSSQLSKV